MAVTHAERREQILQRIADDDCEDFTGTASCFDEHSGREPFAKYGADAYCGTCLVQYALSQNA